MNTNIPDKNKKFEEVNFEMNTNGGFFKRFTKIKGQYPISSIRRLTWKGKIRLGIQVPTKAKDKDGEYKKDQKGDFIQRRDKFGKLEFHPQDVPYFVCPKEVKAMFDSDEPTELDIAFPLSGLDSNGLPDIGGLFPQAYKYYGKSKGLKCVGDGEAAMKANEKGIFEEVECPCDKFGQRDGCSKRASLFFFIPKITMGAIYVIDSGSWNTMVDVQSGIYLALELLKDPITDEYNSVTMLPFKLRRMQKETQYEGRKGTHWPLTCELNLPTEEIGKIRIGKTLHLEQKRVYQLPEMKEEVEKEGTVVEEEIEETGQEIKLRETKEAEEEKKKGEAIAKDIEESRAREVQLKKDQKEGKGKIKTYKESKEIHKKKVEEENKLLLAISEKAQKTGIDTFEKLVKFAVDQKIFETTLTENVARKVLTTNKDVYSRLMKALEQPIDEDKEKLDKIFERFNEVDLDTWKEIAYFACLADFKEPGSPLEELKQTLLNNPEAVEKIIRMAKIREEEDPPDNRKPLKIIDKDAPFPDEKSSDEDTPD